MANKHMKRCYISLVTKATETKMAKMKRPTILSVAKDAEQWDPHLLLVAAENVTATFGSKLLPS